MTSEQRKPIDVESRRKRIADLVRGEDAMAPFMTNIDCATYADYERWLAGQYRQALELMSSIEERNKTPEDHELYDWVAGKCSVYHGALLTFRRVMRLEKEKGEQV